tara:strand:+ start:318 stop:986 length:669 start_codon:yes stop_codon:yes gene_type:complete
MEDKKPKKRGRKPKNKSVSGEKSKKELNVGITENLIVKLNHSEVDNYEISGYTNDEMNEDIKKENTSELCWNCCHCFHEHTYGIPLKYLNKVFYTYGDFCSLECAARYSLDNMKEYNFSEIYSLINLYNNILLNKVEKVEIAPNRLLLQSFGGPLTINEYRSNFNNKDIYDLRIPPILPIKHSINKYELNSATNQNNLKLYRKKPLPSEKKSITTSMNLIIG